MTEKQGSGIFIGRGGSLRLSDLSLTITPEGRPEVSTPTVELAYDLWPLWLRIAIEHERVAKEARQRLEQLTGEHGESHGEELQKETAAGMVAIAAATFALDAFYGAVKARLDTPPPTGRRSRRYALIAETLKRGFIMTQASANALRTALKEALRFRDMTVHPSGEFRGAVLHPVMKVGVAVPHVAFRLENARAVVDLAMSVIEQCASRPRPHQRELAKWCQAVPETISELHQLRQRAG